MRIIRLLIALLISCSAYAYILDTDSASDVTAAPCQVTKSSNVARLPAHDSHNNDLTMMPNRLEDPLLPRIVLFGRIRDKKCTPISGAAVTIWQNDAFGIARYLPEKALSKKIYSDFKATGSALSNNTGEFAFVTLIPQQKNGKRDNINIVIKHPAYPKLSTQIVLLDLNQSHAKTNHVIAREEKRKNITYPVYYFDIVLDGVEQNLAH